MKKVVVNKVREISIEEIENDHIIGILWSTGSKKKKMRSAVKKHRYYDRKNNQKNPLSKKTIVL